MILSLCFTFTVQTVDSCHHFLCSQIHLFDSNSDYPCTNCDCKDGVHHVLYDVCGYEADSELSSFSNASLEER